MGRNILQLAAALPILLIAPFATHASLIGTEITVGVIIGGVDMGTESIVVGDGVEAEGPNFGLDVGESFDFSANTISAVSTGPFDASNSQFIFSDLFWADDPEGILTGFTLETTIEGLDESDVTFGDHFLSVNAGADEVFSAGTATIVLITSHDDGPGPAPGPGPDNGVIPEPSTGLLLGLGLLGLARRRLA